MKADRDKKRDANRLYLALGFVDEGGDVETDEVEGDHLYR